MRIHCLTAVFGGLPEQTLELQDGLNILQAPDEAGKSTWCAFLLSMFYGITIKNPNPFGAASSGRLDCETGDGPLSILRTTRRKNAPLAEFQALRTGTEEPAPGLTGINCGDALLGVNREVYARSAFIQPCGTAVSQDPVLERQIASLTGSGEDPAYAEALEALKKQLNHGGEAGRLPALEAELQETEALLASQAELIRQRENLSARSAELEAHKADLGRELEFLDRWDVQRQRLDLRKIEDAAVQAERKALDFRRRLEEEHVPQNDVTGKLRGALINLSTARKNAEKAQAQSDEAEKSFAQADAALAESPFFGQTAEEARRSVQPPPAAGMKTKERLCILASAVLFIAAASLFFTELPHYLSFLLFGFAVLMALPPILGFSQRKRDIKSRTTAFINLFGTADPNEMNALVDTYLKQLEDRETARKQAAAKAAAAKSVWDTVTDNEAGILAEVRRFAPGVYDAASADAALRASAMLRKQLSDLEKAAREARARADLQAQQTPTTPDDPKLLPPARNRSAVESDLKQTREDIASVRSNLERITGRLNATGEPAVLKAAAERLGDEIARLQGESASIELAMSTLEHANPQLQGRFSHALGKRAREIFSQLTDGHAAARDAGDSTAEALYLAVRLAICDLVLPTEHEVPIVLDDAFANFDDAQCAAALRYLRKEAEKRQILLFTCHSREAAFFQDDPDVSIQHLTDLAKKV